MQYSALTVSTPFSTHKHEKNGEMQKAKSTRAGEAKSYLTVPVSEE